MSKITTQSIRGCSPFYERKIVVKKNDIKSDKKAQICLHCTKSHCDSGTCELFRRGPKKWKKHRADSDTGNGSEQT